MSGENEAEELDRAAQPDWFQYDNHGMILPHSIVGSLEDFRTYVEAKGNKELLKKIPSSSHSFGVLEKHESTVVGNKTKIPSGHGICQTNALENWNTNMRLRKQQQDSLSGLQGRPVENLLMNQANRFRETQEKREMLNQALPLVRPGYGHSVGCMFWRLPQRYGDEVSGITATLTKTERGIQDPSAQIGLPCSILQESGLSQAEAVCHASRTWDQSAYLKQQCQEIGKVVQDVIFKRPDIDKLEVIGSCKPFSNVTISSNAAVENKNKDEDSKDLHEDIVPQSNDVQSESKDLLGPALRVSGTLARWTGNANTKQGQVGIRTTIFFECLTGEIYSSHLKMQNEGSTAIFYSWQQIPLPHNFPHLLSHRKRPYFYFDSSSGVILPGDTQKVEISFKSERPGLQTEVWQLNTHPLLLQGASIEVTFRGMALDQDKTAEIKQILRKIGTKICQSIEDEMVQGIHTPERLSSPAELHQTEEQEFLCKNPKFCYISQPVEDLKKLWLKAKPECTWDFSIKALRQALLSLPDYESADGCLSRETGLAQLNSLLLQLSEPSPKQQNPIVANIGQLLRGDSLDTMISEAMWLTRLHLSEKDTWMDKKQHKKVEDTTSGLGMKLKRKGTATKEKKNMAKSEKESKSSVKTK